MIEVAEPQTVGMNAARLERIAPVMRAYVDRGIYAGVGTLIARRGRVVHCESVGLRDKESGAPMTDDTIVRFYSMTKPIVCTALMTLVEEGRLRLLDPVAKYIPAVGRAKVLAANGKLEDLVRPMLVVDLMTHMSGLTYNFLEDSPVGRDYAKSTFADAGVSLADAVEALAALPLAFQPGSRWHYSVGIDFAARVIEVASGRPLGAFLKERLFDPLGMKDMGFDVPEAKRGRVAAVYGRDDLIGPTQTHARSLAQWQQGVNARVDVTKTYPVDRPDTFARGGHGLFGTIRDYWRFAQMLANGGRLEGARVIGRKTLELMHANHVPAKLMPLELGGFPIGGYGFGLGSRVALDVAQTLASGSVGEFGWAGAAKTYYWVDPREELVGVFITQSMMSFDLPELELKALAYAAIED